MTLRRLLLVFAGGAIGTATRLGLGLAIADAGGFPVATLLVNVLGSLLIGILAARLPQTSDLRVFLGTGVLGGFTTFSAFSLEAALLWEKAAWLAALYVAASLMLSLGAFAAGWTLARV